MFHCRCGDPKVIDWNWLAVLTQVGINSGISFCSCLNGDLDKMGARVAKIALLDGASFIFLPLWA